MAKTALVTGASRGIGAAIARRLAEDGCNVILNYNRSEKEAQALAAALDNAVAIQADITDSRAVNALVEETLRRFGQIDILVNNAGIAQQKLFTDTTEAEWDRMFDVNCKGVYRLCHAVLPDMIRRHSGCIVNLSSIWGITGGSCEVAYSAAKAAVIGLTKGLAKEVGPSGIRVNCVAPGVIQTDMTASLSAETMDALREETPLCALGTPADIAEAVAFLASDRAGFITGQVLSPNGGFVI